MLFMLSRDIPEDCVRMCSAFKNKNMWCLDFCLLLLKAIKTIWCLGFCLQIACSKRFVCGLLHLETSGVAQNPTYNFALSSVSAHHKDFIYSVQSLESCVTVNTVSVFLCRLCKCKTAFLMESHLFRVCMLYARIKYILHVHIYFGYLFFLGLQV